jgi:hypothetical protein
LGRHSFWLGRLGYTGEVVIAASHGQDERDSKTKAQA